MRVTSQVIVILVTGALASTPAPPATAAEHYLVSAVHLPGAGGSLWTTDLEVHNVSGASVSFTVAFLATNQDNSSPPSASFALAAGSAQRFVDVVGSVFGLSSSGALRVSSAGDGLTVTGRTFSTTAAGTSGALVPGLPESEALVLGDDGFLLQLANDSQTRTNVGFVNTTGAALSVETTCFAANGSEYGTIGNVLHPFSQAQVNNIFAAIGAGTVADGYCRVRTTTAAGRFLAYAMVIDNTTGDAWLEPALRAPTVAEPLVVAHVVSSAGRRSDLEVMAVGPSAASYQLGWVETGGGTTATVSFALGAGSATRFVDVVATVFGASGTGSLTVTPTSGLVLATSRSYLSGDYSRYVPALPATGAFTSSQTATLDFLTRSADFGTDLGVVNVSALAVDVDVALYAAAGSLLGSSSHAVSAGGHLELVDALGSDVADAFALVRCTTAGGAVLPYATVTDLATGDAVHVPGQLANDALALFVDGFEGGTTGAWSLAVP